MTNLIQLENAGIESQAWLGALSKAASQTNCTSSLTANGYRIYRPPNISYNSSDSSTKTMWGGFRLRFTNPPFIQNHIYIIMFNIKGQTTNAPTATWSYNLGNTASATQLAPSPSNVSKFTISTNWEQNDWIPFFYKWKIEDAIYKECASTYGSFTAGNTYLSYRDFGFYFGYDSTGTLGTELYIKNLRMFDITDSPNVSINKTGQLLLTSPLERENKLQVSYLQDGEVEGNGFYEY